MATESLLEGYDILPIQRALLAEDESQYGQPGSQHILHHADRATAVTGLQPLPHSAAPDSVPELPSTVPDSQFLSKVASQLDYRSHSRSSDKPLAAARKKMSQASDVATQELSPTYYDENITKSRKEDSQFGQHHEEQFPQPWEDESDDEEMTGVTQHPGDPGFVDLMSSLDPPDGVDDHDEEHNQDQGDHGDDPNTEGECHLLSGNREQDEDLTGNDPGDGHGQRFVIEEEELSRDGPHDRAETAQRPAREEQPDRQQPNSEPVEVDFTLTQTQNVLSQFPESQRFKTPATAGRKRRSNGEFVNSPDLPRNPLPSLKGGKSAPAMGLSQAFAATQANTSPFAGIAVADMLSDRPSPNINLQPRPVTAASSSPMRPISTIKPTRRIGSEPLEHYTSTKESQARRDRIWREQLEKEEFLDDDDDDDDLALSEDEWSARHRRERERDLRVRAKLSPSSPLVASRRQHHISRSSPQHDPRKSSPTRERQLRRLRREPSPSPSRPVPQSQSTESEEETEQEDNREVATAGSSQPRQSPNEEDKENFAAPVTQIPETAARLQRVINEPRTEVQESPLVRHGPRLDLHGRAQTLNSSQPFAVANSQPEHAMKPSVVTQVLKSSATDGVDFVPQSPEASPQATAPIQTENKGALLSIDVARPAPANASVSTSSSAPAPSRQLTQIPNSTIAETSSNSAPDRSGDKDDDGHQDGENEDGSKFDTAQTNLPRSTPSMKQSVADELNCQPTATSPPAKRRKLMAEIAADPSPLKSQIGFDASEALRLDSQFLDPVHRSSISKNETIAMTKDAELLTDVVDPDQVAAHPEVPSQNTPQPMPPRPDRPQRERKPTGRLWSSRILHPKTPAPTSRSSQYDFPGSPPEKVVSMTVSSTRVKRKAQEVQVPPGESSPRKRRKPDKSAATEKARLSKIEPAAQGSLQVLRAEPEPPLSEPFETGNKGEVPEPDNQGEVAPNMVFAVFNGNSRTYHPALCLGRPDGESSRFKIQWPGYDPDVVDEHGVRRLDLRVGDQVKVDLDGFPKVSHVITSFKDKTEREHITLYEIVTDIRGYQTLMVAPKQRKTLPAKVAPYGGKEVPVSAIYLDSNMWNQMKDRVYEFKPVLSSGVLTPVDTASTPSTPLFRSRRRTTAASPPVPSHIDLTTSLFSNMAFTVSYDDVVKRQNLVKLVRENGGIILTDTFLDLFEPDSIQLKETFSSLTFTALLTDRHSRKPKYLQALALGLPCLSGEWVEASIRADRVAPWPSYLLAAGECTELAGAIKSRILSLPLSTESVRVEDMLDARTKPLANSRMIVSMGKGKKAKEKCQTYLALVQALGPIHVEVEPDMSLAKTKAQSAAESDKPFDYILVDDTDLESARDLFSPTTAATLAFEEGERKVPRRGRGRRKNDQPPSQAASETKENVLDGPPLTVKIICNEDIVQSLILGTLWISS